MKLNVYSVFDQKTSAFLPPFTMRSDGEAIRALQGAVDDVQHNFHRYAEDYTLHRLGHLEDTNGVLVPEAPAPFFVIACITLVRDPQLEVTPEGENVIHPSMTPLEEAVSNGKDKDV